MVAQDPEVARPADRLLRRLREPRPRPRRSPSRRRRAPAAAPAPWRRSRPGRGRSSRPCSHASSCASSSSLQPACRASWLSAIRYARFCASLRCSNRITGTSASPSLRAASSRPWPARMPPLLVDQDRVGPAELDHRRRDLIDLRLAVRARVALVRAQAVDRPQLDPVGERDQPGALRCVGQAANLMVRRVVRTWVRRLRRFAGRFAPWRGSEPQEFCGLQAVKCDG